MRIALLMNNLMIAREIHLTYLALLIIILKINIFHRIAKMITKRIQFSSRGRGLGVAILSRHLLRLAILMNNLMIAKRI